MLILSDDSDGAGLSVVLEDGAVSFNCDSPVRDDRLEKNCELETPALILNPAYGSATLTATLIGGNRITVGYLETGTPDTTAHLASVQIRGGDGSANLAVFGTPPSELAFDATTDELRLAGTFAPDTMTVTAVLTVRAEQTGADAQTEDLEITVIVGGYPITPIAATFTGGPPPGGNAAGNPYSVVGFFNQSNTLATVVARNGTGGDFRYTLVSPADPDLSLDDMSGELVLRDADSSSYAAGSVLGATVEINDENDAENRTDAFSLTLFVSVASIEYPDLALTFDSNLPVGSGTSADPYQTNRRLSDIATFTASGGAGDGTYTYTTGGTEIEIDGTSGVLTFAGDILPTPPGVRAVDVTVESSAGGAVVATETARIYVDVLEAPDLDAIVTPISGYDGDALLVSLTETTDGLQVAMHEILSFPVPDSLTVIASLDVLPAEATLLPVMIFSDSGAEIIQFDAAATVFYLDTANAFYNFAATPESASLNRRTGGATVSAVTVSISVTVDDETITVGYTIEVSVAELLGVSASFVAAPGISSPPDADGGSQSNPYPVAGGQVFTSTVAVLTIAAGPDDVQLLRNHDISTRIGGGLVLVDDTGSGVASRSVSDNLATIVLVDADTGGYAEDDIIAISLTVADTGTAATLTEHYTITLWVQVTSISQIGAPISYEVSSAVGVVDGEGVYFFDVADPNNPHPPANVFSLSLSGGDGANYTLAEIGGDGGLSVRADGNIRFDRTPDADGTTVGITVEISSGGLTDTAEISVLAISSFIVLSVATDPSTYEITVGDGSEGTPFMVPLSLLGPTDDIVTNNRVLEFRVQIRRSVRGVDSNLFPLAQGQITFLNVDANTLTVYESGSVNHRIGFRGLDTADIPGTYTQPTEDQLVSVELQAVYAQTGSVGMYTIYFLLADPLTFNVNGSFDSGEGTSADPYILLIPDVNGVSGIFATLSVPGTGTRTFTQTGEIADTPLRIGSDGVISFASAQLAALAHTLSVRITEAGSPVFLDVALHITLTNFALDNLDIDLAIAANADDRWTDNTFISDSSIANVRILLGTHGEAIDFLAGADGGPALSLSVPLLEQFEPNFQFRKVEAESSPELTVNDAGLVVFDETRFPLFNHIDRGDSLGEDLCRRIVVEAVRPGQTNGAAAITIYIVTNENNGGNFGPLIRPSICQPDSPPNPLRLSVAFSASGINGGDGTSGDPYVITNVAAGISAVVAGGGGFSAGQGDYLSGFTGQEATPEFTISIGSGSGLGRDRAVGVRFRDNILTHAPQNYQVTLLIVDGQTFGGDLRFTLNFLVPETEFTYFPAGASPFDGGDGSQANPYILEIVETDGNFATLSVSGTGGARTFARDGDSAMEINPTNRRIRFTDEQFAVGRHTLSIRITEPAATAGGDATSLTVALHISLTNSLLDNLEISVDAAADVSGRWNDAPGTTATENDFGIFGNFGQAIDFFDGTDTNGPALSLSIPALDIYEPDTDYEFRKVDEGSSPELILGEDNLVVFDTARFPPFTHQDRSNGLAGVVCHRIILEAVRDSETDAAAAVTIHIVATNNEANPANHLSICLPGDPSAAISLTAALSVNGISDGDGTAGDPYVIASVSAHVVTFVDGGVGEAGYLNGLVGTVANTDFVRTRNNDMGRFRRADVVFSGDLFTPREYAVTLRIDDQQTFNENVQLTFYFRVPEASFTYYDGESPFVSGDGSDTDPFVLEVERTTGAFATLAIFPPSETYNFARIGSSALNIGTSDGVIQFTAEQFETGLHTIRVEVSDPATSATFNVSLHISLTNSLLNDLQISIDAAADVGGRWSNDPGANAENDFGLFGNAGQAIDFLAGMDGGPAVSLSVPVLDRYESGNYELRKVEEGSSPELILDGTNHVVFGDGLFPPFTHHTRTTAFGTAICRRIIVEAVRTGETEAAAVITVHILSIADETNMADRALVCQPGDPADALALTAPPTFNSGISGGTGAADDPYVLVAAADNPRVITFATGGVGTSPAHQSGLVGTVANTDFARRRNSADNSQTDVEFLGDVSAPAFYEVTLRVDDQQTFNEDVELTLHFSPDLSALSALEVAVEVERHDTLADVFTFSGAAAPVGNDNIYLVEGDRPEFIANRCETANPTPPDYCLKLTAPALTDNGVPFVWEKVDTTSEGSEILDLGVSEDGSKDGRIFIDTDLIYNGRWEPDLGNYPLTNVPHHRRGVCSRGVFRANPDDRFPVDAATITLYVITRHTGQDGTVLADRLCRERTHAEIMVSVVTASGDASDPPPVFQIGDPAAPVATLALWGGNIGQESHADGNFISSRDLPSNRGSLGYFTRYAVGAGDYGTTTFTLRAGTYAPTPETTEAGWEMRATLELLNDAWPAGVDAGDRFTVSIFVEDRNTYSASPVTQVIIFERAASSAANTGAPPDFVPQTPPRNDGQFPQLAALSRPENAVFGNAEFPPPRPEMRNFVPRRPVSERQKRRR
ncbi:MAG: hypothetical protein ACR2QC_03245 [Gammaproteobacteria bacterium]